MEAAIKPDWHCESCNSELQEHELIRGSETEPVEAWGRTVMLTTTYVSCPWCGSDEDLLELK